MGDKLAKELSKKEEYVAIAMVAAKKYQQANLEIIRYLAQRENTPGVYVTLNKPFDTLLKSFRAAKINPDLVLFIDAVTKTAAGEVEKRNNCLFIGSPENLSDLSLAMDQAVLSVPGSRKFLFFDSLNTLLMYNKPATVAKFIHFLSTKMRIWKVMGIIVSLEKESNKELINELMQFCDIRIEL